MPKFVILTHDHPHLHWDLMLEVEDVLWTWRLDSEPVFGECEAGISATRLPDHRVHYLDYEGPVSGDRGTVKRWDSGQYQMTLASEETIQMTLRGEKLNCDMRLIRLSADDTWTFQSAASFES